MDTNQKKKRLNGNQLSSNIMVVVKYNLDNNQLPTI